MARRRPKLIRYYFDLRKGEKNGLQASPSYTPQPRGVGPWRAALDYIRKRAGGDLAA